ncbi:MAG: helix-turn-helix domain-containing protein [Steroidobacteraceae bacterium]
MSERTDKIPREPVAAFRERLLTERPGFREQWEATAAKRSIALALVHLRTEAGRSQADVAKIAGWDKAFVSRLESASGAVPDTATLTRYAAACERALGLVFAEVNGDTAHVIDAVTLVSPASTAHPFERLRGEDLAFAAAVEDELKSVT